MRLRQSREVEVVDVGVDVDALPRTLSLDELSMIAYSLLVQCLHPSADHLFEAQTQGGLQIGVSGHTQQRTQHVLGGIEATLHTRVPRPQAVGGLQVAETLEELIARGRMILTEEEASQLTLLLSFLLQATRPRALREQAVTPDEGAVAGALLRGVWGIQHTLCPLM